MQNERNLLIGALAQAVAGKPLSLPESVDWVRLCDLADAHKVAPLVYDGLQKAGISMPEDSKRRLHRAYMYAIFHDTQMEYCKAQLQSALEEAEVPHIFLKGTVLKHHYPVPALRTMCDMDVLVYAEDFDKIDRVAKALGGEGLPGDGNHRNYAFGNEVAVEFHPNLLHHATPIGTGINPGWQYAKESSGFSKELTEEGVYLNTICHLANHFVAGGVGVRFVMDVWVNRHLSKPEADRRFVEEEFKRLRLWDFARKIEDLAEVWFGNGEMNECLEELGDYILSSGSHGTENQAMLNALSLSPSGNRFSALWKKVFYPKAELEDRFPWCKNRPVLLPAAWCARAFRAVTINGDKIAAWRKGTGNFSKEQIEQNREKLARMGIQAGKK